MLARLDVNVETLLRRSQEDRDAAKAAVGELRHEFATHAEDDKNHFIGVRDEQKRQAMILNRGIGGVLLLQFIILAVVAAWKF